MWGRRVGAYSSAEDAARIFYAPTDRVEIIIWLPWNDKHVSFLTLSNNNFCITGEIFSVLSILVA